MSEIQAGSCQQCGACCAAFRVSFYWAEVQPPGVPHHFTERISPHINCMAGTNGGAPRCIALDGSVGAAVNCTVYTQRPSPCREVQPGDEKCKSARTRHQLPPLSALPARP